MEGVKFIFETRNKIKRLGDETAVPFILA